MEFPLGSSSCPETHSVNQVKPFNSVTHLPLPTECWDQRPAPPCLANKGNAFKSPSLPGDCVFFSSVSFPQEDCGDAAGTAFRALLS